MSYYLSFFLLFFSLIFGFYGVLYYFMMKSLFLEWEIFSFFGSSVIVLFLFDWKSLFFSSIVLLISSMVLLYSYMYMLGDSNFSRFIMLVYLFVLSMLLLIFSPNLVSILLGWDGLGLVSYCLVIYYQNIKSANAGMLTILSNRIGDVFILLSISWLLNFGSWNIFYLQFIGNFFELKLVLLMVVLAAMTKSAQIPFSAWLPAAMAAPTPVSSLVHSSTLVTAGVYLLIRFNYLLGYSSLLFLISSLTMLMSGFGANFEFDLKKIIALSTLSQLGVMILSISLGLVDFAFFHLITHALFKSLLFLCAGAFIHEYNEIQDIRFLSGIFNIYPICSMFFMGCSMSLCGFPFMSGFYSKDLIIEMFWMFNMNMLMFLIIFFGTLFTMSYSLRLIFYIYLKFNSFGKSMNFHGESFKMFLPMSILFISSLFSGSFMSWVFIPVVSIMLSFFWKLFLMVGLLFMSLILLSIILSLNLQNNKFLSFYKFNYFSGMMWFLPILSTSFFMGFLKLGEKLIKNFDHSWVEIFSGQGAFLFLKNSGSLVDLFYKIYFKNYIIIFLYIVFIIYLFY
uniref:NADH-ubiquinone oxidoreductase chain 5 n=1 Tax=Oncopodura yosiiana TaxID=2581075 RepID=A0A6H0EYH8_9HEXA|nr:NADH dehydrogenase subunit 5 [Oncopodura yosiiana]QIT06426.1 NADH dehydrogenase subunit 5 [Oncopodura yosiiana]